MNGMLLKDRKAMKERAKEERKGDEKKCYYEGRYASSLRGSQGKGLGRNKTVGNDEKMG